MFAIARWCVDGDARAGAFALRRDGTEVPVEISLAPTRTRGGLLVQVMIVDLTARKRVEAQLERRLGQQAAIAELGARALEGGPVQRLLEVAVGMVRHQLDVQYAQILEPDDDHRRFTVVANADRPPDVPARDEHGRIVQVPKAARASRSIAPGDSFAVAGSHAEAALRSDGPVLVEDTADAHAPTGLMGRFGFHSGASVRIGSSEAALGVLSAYASAARRFDAHDKHFLVATANVLADAITRRAHRGRHEPPRPD